MNYVKINKVKDRINEEDKHFSKESEDRINEILENIIVEAIKRSGENKRNTVLARDF